MKIFGTSNVFAAATVAILLTFFNTTNAIDNGLTHLPQLDDLTHWGSFVDYVFDYEKEYRNMANDDEIVVKRFKAFQLNMERIKEHNARFEQGEYTFTLGINHLADLSDEEYKQLLGYKKSTGKNRPSMASSTFTAPKHIEDLPEVWDWRQHNAVNVVKNQGQCGSCWAFSAVAAMESAYAISTGKLESFSEQELVDCTQGGIDTCTHGGEMHDGFEEIIQHHGGKIDPDSVYSYTAMSKGVCKAQDDKAVGHFTSYANVTVGDENALKAAVATKGVVSIAIDASSFAFQLYRHGVFNWPFCKNTEDEMDHGVAAVGYGTFKQKDFWLVRNSWGEGWGMHGYIMMSRNKNNQCGVVTDASFPIMTKETAQEEVVSIM